MINQYHDNPSLLLRRLHAKDMNAFSFVFDVYSKQLFFYCRAILGGDPAAEDVVQDTMLRLWDHRTEFGSILSMKAFLYRTARNRSLDMLKHTQVEHHHNAKATLELNESFLEQKLIEEEVISELYRSIDKLPTECARIFRMSLRGMGNKEIAEELSISVSTVKTQKQRAMAALRSHFGSLLSVLLMLVTGHFRLHC